MTKAEIRLNALTLAVGAFAGKPATCELILNYAADFESYLTGPTPEIGAVYAHGSDEPPFGFYTDDDAVPGTHWVHDADGWRYCDDEGRGAVYAWADMQRWGPFTRIEPKS